MSMIDNQLVEFKITKLSIVLKEYNYILKSMQEENYTIEYDSFFEFHELKYDNQVVGFITLDTFIPTEIALSLNECYILPEYRGKGILINVIKKFLADESIRFYIRKPNKCFIHFLLKYNLAFEVAPNLVSSHIKFIIKGEEVYFNKIIKRLYHNLDYESKAFVFYANGFHMGFCNIFCADNMGMIARDVGVLLFSLPRKDDLKRYNLRKKLKKLSVKEINHVSDKYYFEKMDEIDEFNENLLSNLDENNDDILVLGKGNEIQVYENLKPNDMFKIEQATDGYALNGDVDFISYNVRLEYLLNHPEMVGKTVDLDENGDDTHCPFCGEYFKDDDVYCKTCGQVLNSLDNSTLQDLFNF